MPAAVMMDATPATMDVQLRKRGVDGWKRRLSHCVHHRAFRAAAPEFDYFLPKTSDCAASLERDYGVDPDRSYTTLAVQDFDWWAMRPRTFAPPWRLLFVGNDFERKGGTFLLRLYASHLSQNCTLTIVSNDSSLRNRELPPGVSWIQGATPEQIRDLYWNSHLFLFPTRQDFGPQVVGEALSSGLPVITTHVDGAGDVLRNRESGFIFSRDASMERWAERVHQLLGDPAKLGAMSRRARRDAEELLDRKRFDQSVSEVIDRLRADVRHYAADPSYCIMPKIVPSGSLQ
jgi:glycosyltransferase involved in cell wall biosynthesis